MSGRGEGQVCVSEVSTDRIYVDEQSSLISMMM